MAMLGFREPGPSPSTVCQLSVAFRPPLCAKQPQTAYEKPESFRNLAPSLIPKSAAGSVCWFDWKMPRNPGRNGCRVTGSAKIVLVEDEAFQREVIAECLAQHGLRPTTLSSGAELKRLSPYSDP